MTDYSSFLYAISTCLSDESADVKQYASEALIEMAKSNPVLITKTLVGEINGVTAETTRVNRLECVLTLSKIISENFRPELIDLVLPPLIGIVTFVPSLDEKLVQASIDVISSLSENYASDVAAKFPAFSNNTSHLTKFFCDRAGARDASFFVANEKPSAVFESLMGNLKKTTDEKSRVTMCSLLSSVADMMAELYPNGSCLAAHLADAIDVMADAWFKMASPAVQNAILVTIGSVAVAIDKHVVGSKFEKLMPFYGDALGKPALRVSAATGFSSLVAVLENVTDRPKVHVQSIATKLVDFVEADYGKVQTDGGVLKGINMAICALVNLMSTYPRTPLDLVIRKLPSQAALYAMNYFCSAFGQTEFSLDILGALANVKMMLCSADQREQYAACFFTLMKKCVMRVPEYLEIFKNVVTFMSESGPQSRDAIMSFTYVVQQNPFCYSVIFPNLFVIMLDPHFLYGVPTLATAGEILKSYIERSVKQIEIAGISLSSLMSLLLIFSCCELFAAETQMKLRAIVCSLVGATPQEAATVAKTICDRKGADFCVKMLSACQGHINTYVRFGGEKPLLAPKIQAALRAAIAVASGYLMQLECCLSQVDAVHRDIMTRFIQTEVVEIEGISKYLGLVAAAKPDFAIRVVNEQLDILIANRRDKLKFWNKKAIPQMPIDAAVLATALIVEYSPSTPKTLNTIFELCANSFLNDNSVQDLFKLKLIEAAFDRNKGDNSFQIRDEKRLAQQTTQKIKTFRDIREFEAAIAALQAILRNKPALLDSPDAVIKDALEGTKKFKPAEIAPQIVPGIANLIQTIVTVKDVSDPGMMLSFQTTILPLLVVSNWTSICVIAMKQIVNSFKTLQNPGSCLPVAVIYLMLSTIPTFAEQATLVSERLLTLIRQAKYDLSSPAVIANQLLQFEMDDLLPTIFTAAQQFANAPGNYSNACRVFLTGFAEGKRSGAVVKRLVHEYVQLKFSMCEALILLLGSDPDSVIEQILDEPVDGNVSSVLSSLFGSAESKDTAIQKILSCTPEKSMNCLQLLQKVRYSIPFDGNSEIIYVLLAKIALEDCTPEAHSLICDILSVSLANKEPFEADGQARKDIDTKTMIVLRVIFKDLVHQPGVDIQKLFNIAQEMSFGDESSRLVAAAVAGKILSSEISPELSHRVIELLQMTGSPAVRKECLYAMGELAGASLEVKTKEAAGVVSYLIEQTKLEHESCRVGSLLRIVTSLSPDQVFSMASDVLSLTEELLVDSPHIVTVYSMSLLTFIASSARLTSSAEVSKKLGDILPLALVNMQSTGVEASSQAISALCKRLGFPPLSITESVYEFVERNLSVLKASVRDLPAFVDHLLLCKKSANAPTRASVCYLSAALLDECQDDLASKKAEILATISECMVDTAPEVRLSASQSLLLLGK